MMLVRHDIDINEHERLPNITISNKGIYWVFIAVLHVFNDAKRVTGSR